MGAKLKEYDPSNLEGESVRRWSSTHDLTDGDFIIEYGIGYPTHIYFVERGKLKREPFSRGESERQGAISTAIRHRALKRDQESGVVFELRNGELRQIGNFERAYGAKVVWSPTRSSNASRSIRYEKRARPTLRPLEPDSRIRWETKYRIGQVGAVYEFNVKLPPMHGATFNDEDLYIERDIALMVFKDILTKDFKWVGDVYFTGRSSGWLAVEAGKGGATQKQILDIADRVDDARDEFVRYLREEYS